MESKTRRFHGSVGAAQVHVFTMEKWKESFSLWIQLTRPYEDVIGFTGSDKFFTLHHGTLVQLLGMVNPSSQPAKNTPLMALPRRSNNEIASYSASLISLTAVTKTHEDLNS